MFSGKHHRRYKLIIFFTLFLGLIVVGSQFGGTATARSGHSARPSGDPLQINSSANISNTIYLPTVYSKYPWVSPFGAEATRTLSTESMLLTRTIDLNIGWTRMGKRISWRELQPNPGDDIKWDLLVQFEEELHNLRSAGITPVVIIYDSPHWAVIPNVRQDGIPTSCGPIDSDYFDEFADFVQQVTKRYKSPEFDVHNWELGNEIDVDPNLVSLNSGYGCWGDIDDLDYYGGRHYGDMLKYITPVIKSEDSSAKVWIGGLLLATPATTNPALGKPENFLKGILEAGAAPYFDILPYHGHMKYYNRFVDVDTVASGDWVPWGGGILGKARYLREMMQVYNVEKVLVQGEIGIGCDKAIHDYCDPPDDQFYRYQADMLTRIAVRVASAEHIKGISYYPIDGPGWRDQGLLDSNNDPRPSYISYQNLTQQLNKTTYISQVDYGIDIEAYAFNRGFEQVHVLWLEEVEEEGETQNILVPQSMFKEAYLRDGTQILEPPLDGTNYVLPVRFSPIYIILSP